MVQPPGDTSRWFVIEKSGAIYSFSNNELTTTRTEFGRITVDSTPTEGGLLGIAFHPNYAQNGFVFLSYTYRSNTVPFTSRLSRFKLKEDRSALDPASELILMSIKQPFDNHNGGNIAFGPDGYLYFGLGDGGASGDPWNHGQTPRTLLGAMLRVDVNVSADDLAAGRRYTIPTGNAFTGNPVCLNGACPDQSQAAEANLCPGSGCAEIFAWGLRNPWRWSFDRQTGDLWAADVGQDQWEEIDLIQAGKNYGWNCYEGKHEFNTWREICPTNLAHTLPIVEYSHNLGASVTGGYVYRGQAIPALTGRYVFTDAWSGRVWAVDDPKGTAPAMRELLDTTYTLVSFAEGHDGELYLLDLYGGIYKIVPGTAPPPAAAFPEQLRDTGCADASNPKLATPGMIPYEVNSALWSDGAAKKRWLAIPDGTTIERTEDQDWLFPPGAVLRKDFYLDGKIVETRLLAHHTDGDWAGYSYAWNPDQTGATHVPDGKTETIGAQQWTFPSGSDCLGCHTFVAGRTLGPETAQLNRAATYESTGRIANQVYTLNALDIFSEPYAAPSEFAAPLPDPADTGASLEARAKAYLHANCSHCHRPGGLGGGKADFRFNVAFADMNVCNTVPADPLGVTDARLFAPGDPGRSVIALRMRDTGDKRMPPLASHVVDTQAVETIESWIRAKPNC